MALYVPAGSRRRRTVLIAACTLIAGLAVGYLVGLAGAPSARDQIRSIQADARQTAAGLRVLSLHDQARTISSTTADGGADLVLNRTKRDLADEIDRAPWIGVGERKQLLAALAGLTERKDRSSTAFGASADAMATRIETAFGL